MKHLESALPKWRNLKTEDIFLKCILRLWPQLEKHLFNVRLDPEERTDLKYEQPQGITSLLFLSFLNFLSFLKYATLHDC
jgi:hypothetical protein